MPACRRAWSASQEQAGQGRELRAPQHALPEARTRRRLPLVGQELHLFISPLDNGSKEGTLFLPALPVAVVGAALALMVRALPLKHLTHQGKLAVRRDALRLLCVARQCIGTHCRSAQRSVYALKLGGVDEV